MMKVFPLDLIMGLLLSLMLLCILAGSYIFISRRERGPLYLIVSGLIGVIGPILHILAQVEVVGVGPVFIWGPIIIWSVGTVASVFQWRRRE